MITSVEEWLYHLPEPYRTKALRHHSFYNKLGNADCLANALVLAFKWGSTSEGGAYWREVHTRCLRGEFDKLIIDGKITRRVAYKPPISKKDKVKLIVKAPVVKETPPKIVEVIIYRPFEERKKQIDKLNNN